MARSAGSGRSPLRSALFTPASTASSDRPSCSAADHSACDARRSWPKVNQTMKSKALWTYTSCTSAAAVAVLPSPARPHRPSTPVCSSRSRWTAAAREM
eukprot:1959818-Prymnesium_polylepis.1